MFDFERYQELHAEDPPCTHIGITTRRSRKERRCSACGQKIVKGEAYDRDVWIVDGQWDVQTNHIGAPYCAEYDLS